MKIVLTGSLGHISKPLAQELLQKGHSVTVISSNPERQKDIEALGASAAIGELEDVDFLTAAFTGADAVYCMIPPSILLNPRSDVMAATTLLGKKYAQAIREAAVKRVADLSSVGAHTGRGNGMLRYAYAMEQILEQLPSDVAVKFIRPVGFYYNLLAFIPPIKEQGAIVSNYGGETVKPWVSVRDIASAVAEELLNPFEGRTARYVASDELSCNEIARILGAAVGKPDLSWHVISDEQMFNRLTEAGMNPGLAKGLVEMNASMHSGELYEDYYRHRPALGKIKMTDFARDFAAAYHKE